MHEERDTLWHFVMSIVKYRESHYVIILDIYVKRWSCMWVMKAYLEKLLKINGDVF